MVDSRRGFPSADYCIGGLSYFSPQYGFACDNVREYELVLANGDVTVANRTHNTDLFEVMCGASSNLGIVTRFDLHTFNQGQMWGGNILYNFTTLPQQSKAFIDFATDPDYDEKATLIHVYVYRQGRYLASNTMVYTDPEPNPPALQRFTTIQPQIVDNTRIGTHEALVDNRENARGLRNAFFTTTWKADLRFLQDRIVPAWLAFSNTTHAVAGLENALLNQPVPLPLRKQSARRSNFTRNVVADLDDSSTIPIILLMSLTWNNTSDDALVNSAAKAFIDTVEADARKENTYLAYKYINYADGSQDVYGGYETEYLERMREVSRKYDPSGVFQKSMPGGFKILPK